jgi:hypothetical protein
MERGIKTGPKPRRIINETWRPNLAYAIGLIATDGCLSNDGLLVDLTSKEKEQLTNYSKCLGINFKIGLKWANQGKEYLRIQFKNRFFYDFLLSIGLTPKKSLTMGKLTIPEKYFFDFLRGCFDGDGCSYSYWDPRWRSSFMFYIGFTSASKNFINWIQEYTQNLIGISGHITKSKNENTCYQLKYAKYEGVKLVRAMYKKKGCICLKRKKLKINKSLSTIGVPLIR